MYSDMDDWAFPSQVSPFGYLRIDTYLRFPAAFRSLSRPSSASGAKAFPLCSFLLDRLIYLYISECSSDTTFLFFALDLSKTLFCSMCFIFLTLFSSMFSFQGAFSTSVYYTCFRWPNGDCEIRTRDPLLARQVLSQLS